MREQQPRSADLLDWYDQNARALPWRVPPLSSAAGVLPDPYHVWLSEVMLQQTTVAAVINYFNDFVTRWPDVHALAAAETAEVLGAWAGLGYYARARNLVRCARMVSHEYAGQFPDTEAELRTLPGIGPYTAGAIAAIAFGKRATVVDANVERVMARIYAVKTPLPDCKTTLREHADVLTPHRRAGDYAQAVMDLGAGLCGKNPDCDQCPWQRVCRANHLGIAADLPKKRAKAVKPVRNGIVFVATRGDGKALIETRPDRGLLGGMQGFPGSQWVTGTPSPAPPFDVSWKMLPETVAHSFTHFKLYLKVAVADVGFQASPANGYFTVPEPSELPTVMRKVWKLAQNSLTEKRE